VKTVQEIVSDLAVARAASGFGIAARPKLVPNSAMTVIDRTMPTQLANGDQPISLELALFERRNRRMGP
jgi:hypothetical protein